MNRLEVLRQLFNGGPWTLAVVGAGPGLSDRRLTPGTNTGVLGPVSLVCPRDGQLRIGLVWHGSTKPPGYC